MENKNLPKVKNELKLSENIIQVTKTSDLLRAKPINEQILKYGRNEVNLVVAASVNKCIDALGIEKSNYEIQLLIEDLIEKYKWDAVEDIQICLKKSRSGYYGTTYNKLNMIVITEWMSKHLEEKAIEREREHERNKKQNDFPGWETKEDYIKAATKPTKKKEPFKIDEEYKKFKIEYLKNAKPEGTIKYK